jgi:hypothetical protein
MSHSSISRASHRRSAYADLMAFSCTGSRNRISRYLKFDVYGQLRSSATPLAEIDKRRNQERAHVLWFGCQAMLCGVQHALSVGIHELLGMANKGLRPGRLFLRHNTHDDRLNARLGGVQTGVSGGAAGGASAGADSGSGTLFWRWISWRLNRKLHSSGDSPGRGVGSSR